MYVVNRGSLHWCYLSLSTVCESLLLANTNKQKRVTENGTENTYNLYICTCCKVLKMLMLKTNSSKLLFVAFISNIQTQFFSMEILDIHSILNICQSSITTFRQLRDMKSQTFSLK